MHIRRVDPDCKEVTTDLHGHGMNCNEMIAVFFGTCAQGLDSLILFPMSDSMRISLEFSH